MSDTPIVHIIDDDEAVRDSLKFLLTSAKFATRDYESAVEFLDQLDRVGRGCVVTDVRMPGLTGIDLLRELKARGRMLPVIVITGHGDVPLAVEAMKSGAMDFIEKPFNDDVILRAVQAALDNAASTASREQNRAEILDKLQTLSNRERQVLEGLVRGAPNKTIAYDLGISARTVEVYRANVMSKMGAGSLSELVRRALVAGIGGSQTPSA